MFSFKKNNLFSTSLILILFFLTPFSPQKTSAQTITQTENISISATVGSIPTIDPGGSGGGGGMIYQSGVRFSGSAYPNGSVVVQKGLVQVASVVTDEKGYFTVTVPEDKEQLFTLFAKDTLGRQSTLLNFPTIFYSGYLTDITGIRFAPTILTDKIAVKNGDFLTVEGIALPDSSLEIVIDGQEDTKFILNSNAKGEYNITLPVNLKNGDYVVKTHYIGDKRFSKAIKVSVGNVNISEKEATNNVPGDCNFDQNVTLSDFSILAYWFGKSNPPTCVDANHDGVINLVDFSILAYYWNG